MTTTVKKCKYCLKPLDTDGYCTSCKMGRLYKKLDELKKAQGSK